MPVINVTVMEGYDAETKRVLSERLTEAPRENEPRRMKMRIAYFIEALIPDAVRLQNLFWQADRAIRDLVQQIPNRFGVIPDRSVLLRNHRF